MLSDLSPTAWACFGWSGSRGNKGLIPCSDRPTAEITQQQRTGIKNLVEFSPADVSVTRQIGIDKGFDVFNEKITQCRHVFLFIQAMLVCFSFSMGSITNGTDP
jgi:hypothetical protein